MCNPFELPANLKILVFWDDVRLFMMNHPDNTREKDDNGQTPLHLACANAAPFGVLSELLSILQDKEKNGDGYCIYMVGQTHLHSACEYEAQLDVVTLLLSIRPDAVTMENIAGRKPIHYVCHCQYRPSLDMVWPDAVREKDSNGWVPLHSTYQGRSSLAVVSLLMSSWPDAAK
eukprot:3997750-Ditylum_brightwellii.AAC.1